MIRIKWVLFALALAAPNAWADTWVKCSEEGGTCRFEGVRRVGYGTDNKWTYRQYENSVACKSSAFGGDPAPGKRKRCRYLLVPDRIGYMPNAPQWAKCAQEGGVCRVDGKRKVVFGTDSRWHVESFVSSIECTTGVFGDPAPGKKKECRVSR